MKIALNEVEQAKCKKLLEVKELNISAVEFLIEYLNFHSKDISESDIKLLSKKYSLNDSFVRAMKKHMGVNNDIEEFESINSVCKLENVTCLDAEQYKNDSYYKNIGNINGQVGTWKFLKLCYAPFEGFVSDEIEVDKNLFAEHTPFSFFKEKFEYLAVVENDEIWMSVIPHEINTMKQPINEATGRVLVLGLGLGYFVYKILEKNNIDTIDVIEKDPRVIKLFNEKLIEKFPHKEKINIILGDAIEYTKNSSKKYDFVFSDIWHNVNDGEMLYILLKNNEKFHKESKFSYWIENSILAMLRRQTLTVFEEELNGSTENDYLSAKNDNDKIINAIHRFHKNTSISSFNDLHSILTDEKLKKMAANLKLN